MAVITAASWIREARDRKHWTQAELARRGGFREKDVSRWETGVDLPKLTSLIKLARALHEDPPLSLFDEVTRRYLTAV